MYRFTMIALMVLSSSFAMAEPGIPVTPDPIQNIVLTRYNTISLSQAVGRGSVAPVIEGAYRLSAQLPPNKPIYLVLDTPGGSVTYGASMIAALQALPRPVHTVTMFAASMGFHTVQGLGKRYILSNGILMSHKASGGVQGELPGNANVRLAFWTRLVETMDEAVVKRVPKYTLKQYQDLIDNEFWCSGQDCIDAGFADELVTVKCDSSLFTRRGHACPLIPRPVSGLFGEAKEKVNAVK